MKENNVLVVEYFKTLINNGWIEPKMLMEKLDEIEDKLKNTQSLRERNLLKAQKMVILEVLK